MRCLMYFTRFSVSAKFPRYSEHRIGIGSSRIDKAMAIQITSLPKQIIYK